MDTLQSEVASLESLVASDATLDEIDAQREAVSEAYDATAGSASDLDEAVASAAESAYGDFQDAVSAIPGDATLSEAAEQYAAASRAYTASLATIAADGGVVVGRVAWSFFDPADGTKLTQLPMALGAAGLAAILYTVLAAGAPRRHLESVTLEDHPEIETVADLLERDLVHRVTFVRTSGEKPFLLQTPTRFSDRHPARAVELGQLVLSQRNTRPMSECDDVTFECAIDFFRHRPRLRCRDSRPILHTRIVYTSYTTIKTRLGIART